MAQAASPERPKLRTTRHIAIQQAGMSKAFCPLMAPNSTPSIKEAIDV
jgi:hypothetical protein